MSAWICMHNSLAVTPPSTRSAPRATPQSPPYRFNHIPGLIADRLQGGAGQVGAGVVAGQPDDGASCVRPPVRGEEAREGRDEVDAASVADLAGQCLALGRAGDDAQLVAQPLDGGTGDRDGTLQ